MSDSPPSEYITRLSIELRERLADVEYEAVLLRRALSVLDCPAARSRARGDRISDGTALERRLLEAVAADPGARATVIALGEGRPPEHIKTILASLHVRGVVEPEGLGWRLAPGTGA